MILIVLVPPVVNTPRCANFCDNEVSKTDLKRCTGCKKAWYCSQVCQKEQWRRHIFDCNPKRPIATVYYLSRACFEDLIPVHVQTRRDFGFEKAKELVGGRAQSMLLGLWIGVFRYLDVPEKEVQKWQAEGRMVEAVKAEFARIPPQAQGGYFQWFLEHQNILDGSSADKKKAEESVKLASTDAIRRAWIQTGGSPSDSVETIHATVNALPDHVQACHQFYRLLAFGTYPGPNVHHWMSFGFVAAMHQAEEIRLSGAYRELVGRCSFVEFCAAYDGSTMLDLAEAHGVYMTRGLTSSSATFLRDVMSASPRRFKSVWYLKQYIDRLLCAEPSAPPVIPHQAVHADYGLMNCRDTAEEKLLDELYRKYFAHAHANPLDLHKACIRGALVDYIGGFVKLKPRTAMYKRLLENAYPLAGLGELQGMHNSRTLSWMDAGNDS